MISPYYQDDDCTIYHGDCLEIMPELEPVDLVLTSPPYNVGKDYGKLTDDNRDPGEYWKWYKHWLSQVFNCADNQITYVISGMKQFDIVK